jgi:hypothetical protein
MLELPNELPEFFCNSKFIICATKYQTRWQKKLKQVFKKWNKTRMSWFHMNQENVDSTNLQIIMQEQARLNHKDQLLLITRFWHPAFELAGHCCITESR